MLLTIAPKASQAEPGCIEGVVRNLETLPHAKFCKFSLAQTVMVVCANSTAAGLDPVSCVPITRFRTWEMRIRGLHTRRTSNLRTAPGAWPFSRAGREGVKRCDTRLISTLRSCWQGLLCSCSVASIFTVGVCTIWYVFLMSPGRRFRFDLTFLAREKASGELCCRYAKLL